MTPDRARELCDLVRLDVDQVRIRLTELYRAGAWRLLGYATWGEMCAAEFSTAVGALLPREQRRELVVSLTGDGLSTRAIGQALGMPHSTVHDQLAGHRTVATTGLDGRVRRMPPRRAASKPAREGTTTWSRRVQAVSARCPMADLTTAEVEELLGAATFLRDYCQGELIGRNQR